MTISFTLGLQLLQGTMLIALAPGFYGLLDYLKAIWQGRNRRFAYVLQPYRDLGKLFRKPPVRARTTSWVFAIAPLVVLASYTILAFIVPVLTSPLLVVDLIVVLYILGLARFTLSLAGLDAGATLGGLGGSREMFLQFLTEVGLVFVLAALALQWNTLSLVGLFDQMAGKGIQSQHLGMLFLMPALALLILFETGRIPVDNPETNLELTMSRKAITLEYAGRDLALLEWAEMIKLIFLFTLFFNLFLPFLNPANDIQLGDPWIHITVMGLSWLLEVGLLVLCLAGWEVSRPKSRLRKVTGLAWFSIAFSLVSIVFTIATRSAI